MNEKLKGKEIRVGDRVTIKPRGKKKTLTAEFSDGGVHRRKSLKTSNEKVAVKRATLLAAELEAGEYRAVPQTKIEASAKAYIEYLETKKRKPKTITRYRGELKRFTAFAAEKGVRQLGQVSMLLIDAYRAYLQTDEVLAESSVYHESVVVKQLMKWSYKRKLIKTNAIEDYELEKPKKTKKPAPTLEQVDQILDECSPRNRRLLAWLAFTGMRVSSLQAQRRDWVEWDIGRIKYNDVKKDEMVEEFPLHPRLLKELEGLPDEGHDLLFTADPSAWYPGGDHCINSKRLNERFKAAAKRAGINKGDKKTDFTLHSLRHFFKRFTTNNGIGDRIVDHWQNHTDPRVGGVYYDIDWADSRRLMDTVPFGGNDDGDQGTLKNKEQDDV